MVAGSTDLPLPGCCRSPTCSSRPQPARTLTLWQSSSSHHCSGQPQCHLQQHMNGQQADCCHHIDWVDAEGACQSKCRGRHRTHSWSSSWCWEGHPGHPWSLPRFHCSHTAATATKGPCQGWGLSSNCPTCSHSELYWACGLGEEGLGCRHCSRTGSTSRGWVLLWVMYTRSAQ